MLLVQRCQISELLQKYKQATKRKFATIPRNSFAKFGKINTAAPLSCVDSNLYLGIDFGTSGARAVVINDSQQVCFETQARYGLTVDLVESWRVALFQLFGQIDEEIKSSILAVAIDGTSGTCMLIDRQTGQILTKPKLYNESQQQAAAKFVQSIAPTAHTTTSSTSSLCKLVSWHQENVWQQFTKEGKTPVLISQADWIASLLHGQRDISDYNNVLKLGYDPEIEKYPAWLVRQPFANLFPVKIRAPGDVVGSITTSAAQSTGLNINCSVCAGTTDSIAAFIAAGVTEIGTAVTSLGSTLAIKMLSDTRVDDAKYGIYSHKLGKGWLVGGASNTGGAVLKKYFTPQQLVELSAKIDLSSPSPLDYYPLISPGERFPINDPQLQPKLEPRPKDDVQFLYGILQGISKIESMGYKLLGQLGASALKKVYTAGGGSKNKVWQQLREQQLGVEVVASPHVEAAYGAALLAKQGVNIM